MNFNVNSICRKLNILSEQFIEIEVKRRIDPNEYKAIHKYLSKQKNVQHAKTAFFFDQFLDTPAMDICHKGASLRVRYKRNGSRIYLQYKGPGFRAKDILFRSEFSSDSLHNVLMEESHHDIVHFNERSIRAILIRHVPPAMAHAMEQHLGAHILSKISKGPFICIYRKEKFRVNLGTCFLEPSLDRVFSFHSAGANIHPLSTFYEYENEIKTYSQSLEAKLKKIDEVRKFDKKLIKRFSLPLERMDKYHRMNHTFTSSAKNKRQ